MPKDDDKPLLDMVFVSKEMLTGADQERSDIISTMISQYVVDKKLISDGFYTFGELYAHKGALFITVCRLIAHSPCYQHNFPVWRSRLHSDGSLLEGWFVMGINKEAGTQITYHLPMTEWVKCWFADTLPEAPPHDGHSPDDVLLRLNKII